MRHDQKEDPMEEIQRGHAYKKINKLTVENGGFSDVDQKKEFNKQLILALVHEGFNLLSISKKLSISRSSIYNYMAEDKEFESGVRAGGLQENQIKAMIGLIDNVKKGDLGAQKYFLDKTKYFEKRQDIAEQNDYSSNNQIITIKDDVESIAASLVDEETLRGIKESNENLLMRSLEARDDEIQEKFKEVKNRMDNESEE